MRLFRIIILACLILTFFARPAFDQPTVIKRMDFTQANLVDVLRAITNRAGLNLVVSDDKSGVSSKKITISLRNIAPLDAIDFILRTNGYSFEKQGNAVIVSTLAKDLVASAYRTNFNVVSLKYLSAERAALILEKISSDVSMVVGGTSNSLLLRGRSFDVEQIRDLILSIDKPAPQVLIEGKVVEVSESGIEELGIKWGKKEGKFMFSVNKDNGDMRLPEDILAQVELLVGEGKAKVIANPRISTLDDHEAEINIGSRIPYAVPASVNSSGTEWAVQYLDAGVNLKILPKIGEGGFITALIKPEVSSISEWRATSAGEFPVITTRNAESTVRVKDGETIAIGGLINEAERENLSRIPILGDMPFIGFFFSRKVKEKAKTEIVFLVTPHIIN